MSEFGNLPLPADIEAAQSKLKEWDIWSEGYAANEGRFGAFRLNSEPIKANTFHEAVEQYIRSLSPRDRKTYSYNLLKGYWTGWACRLYDNEEDARRSFG